MRYVGIYETDLNKPLSKHLRFNYFHYCDFYSFAILLQRMVHSCFQFSKGTILNHDDDAISFISLSESCIAVYSACSVFECDEF